VGRDVSFGLYDVIGEAFGFTPLELEGREGVLLDHRLANGGGGAAAAEAEAARGEWCRRLREGELFRRLQGAGVLLAMSAVTPEGGLALATSREFEAAMRGAPWQACVDGRGVLPTYLWARCVCVRACVCAQM
jgi:hypothetical protein